MLEVLPKIAKMQASYALGKPLALPMNLTISVSYRCNSRCKTCNVWQRPNDDFTIEEYDQLVACVGRAASWFPFSGGEPALRKDLPKMFVSAYRHCRPGIINIPTNGIQDKIIPGRIERVLQAAPTRKVIINLSLDGIAEKHDIVRGVKGNFERAMRTYAGPKALKGRYKNFTLGMHTVISRMKNPMGILPCPDRRARHTFGIDQCIVDMNRGIKPHLTIVDGSVGQDGDGPLYGDKTDLQVLVAGRNSLAGYLVCCWLFGVKTHELPHLSIAHALLRPAQIA